MQGKVQGNACRLTSTSSEMVGPTELNLTKICRNPSTSKSAFLSCPAYPCHPVTLLYICLVSCSRNVHFSALSCSRANHEIGKRKDDRCWLRMCSLRHPPVLQLSQSIFGTHFVAEKLGMEFADTSRFVVLLLCTKNTSFQVRRCERFHHKTYHWAYGPNTLEPLAWREICHA